MVEYSRETASASELGNYSEEGYQFEDVYKDPDALYQDMEKSGINQDSMTRLDNINKKQQAPNPKLVREKQLKKLFIQYVRKYISNPQKYLQYPKQIKNLPSWFDEALVLFKEVELSRSQKRMLREYFYGLIKYRDDKLAMVNEGGIVNPDEMNRQLGQRSPYSANEEDLDSMQFPRQQDVKRLDVNELMRNNEQMNVRRATPEQSFDRYNERGNDVFDENPEQPKRRGASLGMLGVSPVRPSNVEDYTSFNKKRNQTQVNPSARPHPKLNLVKSTQSQTRGLFTQPDIPTRGGMGTNLTSFIIGGNSKPSISPPKHQQPGYMNEKQQPREPPAWLRASKKVRVSADRKITIKKASPKRAVNSKKPMFHIKQSSQTMSKMFDNIRNVTKKSNNKGIGVVDIKIGKVGTKSKSTGKVDMNIGKITRKSPKKLNGLETVRGMDKLFGQIRSVSHKNFGKENMKMKVVDNIKDQCNKAFANNKFKQESLNMKKNFFNDVKASYPQMRMDIKEMGNIRENEMMSRSMHDVPKIINSKRTTNSLMIKRGDMRPESMGIDEYDFSIEPLGNKRRKPKLEMFDEEDFINRQD